MICMCKRLYLVVRGAWKRRISHATWPSQESQLQTTTPPKPSGRIVRRHQSERARGRAMKRQTRTEDGLRLDAIAKVPWLDEEPWR